MPHNLENSSASLIPPTLTDPTSSSKPPGRGALIEAAVIEMVVFLGLVFVVHDFALGWDEGFTFDRLGVLEPWLARVIDPATNQRTRLFEADVIERHWRFSREEPDGHGPFYALLSLLGHALTHWILAPPNSYRVGSIALFSIAIGSVYLRLRRHWDCWSALVAIGLLATTPRLLPEIGYALIDGPLVSLALLSWASFVACLDESRWRPRLRFGCFLGMAMATKLTGWLLPAPYLGWAVWHAFRARRREGVVTVAVALCTAGIVCFALNVGWWANPVDGIVRFFRSNLTRDETIPIGIEFLGRRYPFSLPWYNTAVWTVVATPVGTLTLGAAGIVLAIRRLRSDSVALLLWLNWLLLMVVRALPQAPGHDGTRQLSISFAFLALLAGFPLSTMLRGAGMRGTAVTVALGLFALGESTFSAWRFHPHQLSYYSPLVGGLPGAVRWGFEATYFWDSLTPDVLDWLNTHTDPNRSVLFRNNTSSFDYLEQWGRLQRRHFKLGVAEPPQWIVMQNRPGIFREADDWLFAVGRPEFEKTLFGVPLIRVYPFEQWRQANEAVRNKGSTKEDSGP
jgi:hypothetical protein